MQVPITVALAELKTLDKRIAKKEKFVLDHLTRDEKFTDPLAKEGGSPVVLERALQSLTDMRDQYVGIKLAIAAVNAVTEITVNDVTKTIAEWLIWKREVAPRLEDFYKGMRGQIYGRRRGGFNIQKTEERDFIVHISEKDLADWADRLENIVGTLDGQLSLKNAVTMVDIP
jgi:hypothetical protein